MGIGRVAGNRKRPVLPTGHLPVFPGAGLRRATTTDFADKTDLSIASLSQYFPNEGAILTALTKRHITTTNSSLADMLDKFPANSDLEVIVRAVVGLLVEQQDLYGLHLLVMHAAHAPTRSTSNWSDQRHSWWMFHPICRERQRSPTTDPC